MTEIYRAFPHETVVFIVKFKQGDQWQRRLVDATGAQQAAEQAAESVGVGPGRAVLVHPIHAPITFIIDAEGAAVEVVT